MNKIIKLIEIQKEELKTKALQYPEGNRTRFTLLCSVQAMDSVLALFAMNKKQLKKYYKIWRVK